MNNIQFQILAEFWYVMRDSIIPVVSFNIYNNKSIIWNKWNIFC